MQGENLSILFENKNSDWRKDTFYKHRFDHPRIPKSEGVISKSNKYFVYYEQQPVY